MARGSGALSGYADVLIEMTCCSLADGDRRRRLQAWSRHDETPRQQVIELTADGTNYVLLGDFAAVEFAVQWELLRGVLAEAMGKMSRRELLKAWPAGKKPDELTLYRWLEKAVARGWVKREGAGHK